MAKVKTQSYADGDIVSSPVAKKQKGGTEPVGKEARGTAYDCLETIRQYEKKYDKWTTRGKGIVERYRDERSDAENASRNMNILWSNVQILSPTLYARAPSSEVTRRFKDRDAVGRVAAETMERAVNMEIERTGLDEVLEQCVEDRLLPGRGQAWVSYNPSMVGEDDKEKSADSLVVDYVHWKDFGHSPVPTWKRVTKVWRWKYFERKEFIDRFGDKYADQVEFAKGKADDDEKDKRPNPMARVAEVWDKRARKVYWVSKSVPDYLDEYDYPLEIQNGFPCPPPLYATKTNETLVPVPDFYLYQDQANEVDKLTNRINNLTNALKIAGVYDESLKELETLFDPRGSRDNLLVPVSMVDLTGKGGIDNVLQLVDVTKVVQTLQACYEARRQAIQAIYEITGISDVIRGATDPNETARAQEIKSQFGGTRIREMQQDVAKFSRDIIAIMAEIIAENYEPISLWEMTYAESFVGTITTTNPLTQQTQEQPNVQVFAEAVKLLRSDKMRSYRVDIETDSTIALDEDQEKQAAQEFVKVVGGFLAEASQLVASSPQALPMVSETLMYLARRYKAGRTLENSIEQTIEQMQQAMAQPKPPPPEVEAEQQKLALEDKKIGQDGQKALGDQEIERGKLSIEDRKVSLEERKWLRESSQPMNDNSGELALKRDEMNLEHQLAQQKMLIEAQTKIEIAAIQAMSSAQQASDGQERQAKSEDRMGQIVAQAMNNIAEAMNKPRQLTVNRENGQVTGGTAA